MSSPAPALGAWPPQPSDELGSIAGGQPDFDANGELCVIADRLYLASLASRPAPRPDAMFLTLSKKMQYAPFCADFGPVNLGSHFAQACLISVERVFRTLPDPRDSSRDTLTA